MSPALRVGLLTAAALAMAVGAWSWTRDAPAAELPGPPPLSAAELSALPDTDVIGRLHLDILRRVHPRPADRIWLRAQPEAVANVLVLACALNARRSWTTANLLEIQREEDGLVTLDSLGEAAAVIGDETLASACRSGDPARVDHATAGQQQAEILRCLRTYIRGHVPELCPR